MELHGSLINNLEAAVQSARRLRGKAVYPQTVQFWTELLVATRQALANMIDRDSLTTQLLADQLEEVLRGFDKAHSAA
jgi:hypothetical protein